MTDFEMFWEPRLGFAYLLHPCPDCGKEDDVARWIETPLQFGVDFMAGHRPKIGDRIEAEEYGSYMIITDIVEGDGIPTQYFGLVADGIHGDGNCNTSHSVIIPELGVHKEEE